MGANKTEKAIERVSRAAGGVRKIVDVFEDQALIKANHLPTHTSPLPKMSTRFLLTCER
jgi:hypothetical protein